MGNSNRSALDQLVSIYADIQVGQLDKMYGSIFELITTNSPTFDDSGEASLTVDSAADVRGMDFSNTIETMDAVEYSKYG